MAGPPGSSANPTAEQQVEQRKVESVTGVLDCIMFSRRSRYYPFRGSIKLRRPDPQTGKFTKKGAVIHLDPVARWHEQRMGFVLFAESLTEDGGMDLHERPHAVLAVPLAALQSIGGGESVDFNVTFLFRWGPDTSQRPIHVKAKRSESFNYRYTSVEEMPFFTAPAGNPRATMLSFNVFLTWDCEQEFRAAISMGMTRAEVMERITVELQNLRVAADKGLVPGVKADPLATQEAGSNLDGSPPKKGEALPGRPAQRPAAPDLVQPTAAAPTETAPTPASP